MDKNDVIEFVKSNNIASLEDINGVIRAEILDSECRMTTIVINKTSVAVHSDFLGPYGFADTKIAEDLKGILINKMEESIKLANDMAEARKMEEFNPYSVYPALEEWIRVNNIRDPDIILSAAKLSIENLINKME